MATAQNGTQANSNGQNDVTFSATPGIPDVDLISPDIMNEIVRRLQGSVGGGVTGAILYGSVPPQDKSQLWGNTNDNKVYRYDPGSGEWVTTDQDASKTYPGLSIKDGQQIIDRGDGIYFTQQYSTNFTRTFIPTVNTQEEIDIFIEPSFKNTDYGVAVVPEYDTNGSARWWMTRKDPDRCTLQYIDPGWIVSGGDPHQISITFIEHVTKENFISN